MCRLYGFRANEPTKVECTLVHAQNALMVQSEADLSGKEHTDGWGIGFFQNGTPVIERRATAAYKDLHFSHTAERVFAKTVLAHVRRATVGEPALSNTHPFVHGRWMFAHNGTLTGVERLRPRLESEIAPSLLGTRRGNTDSELAFLWILSKLRRAGAIHNNHMTDAPTFVAMVGDCISELAGLSEDSGAERPAQLNTLLSNGIVLIATRWNHSLFWVVRQGIHDCEICGIPHIHHHSTEGYRAVVVASEPISDEEWKELPNRSVLFVNGDVVPHVHPIEPTRALRTQVPNSGHDAHAVTQ